jgi:SulP family sulfate permease
VPSPLVAIIVLTAVAIGIELDVNTVGDMGELPDSLPVFLLPDVPLNLETLRDHLPLRADAGGGGPARVADDRPPSSMT